jgi:hypothetical protein
MGKKAPLRKHLEKLFPGDWAKYTPNSPRYGFLAALSQTLTKNSTLAPPWVVQELMHHVPSETIQTYFQQGPTTLTKIQDCMVVEATNAYEEAIDFSKSVKSHTKEKANVPQGKKETEAMEAPDRTKGPIHDTQLNLATPPRKKRRVKRTFSDAKPKPKVRLVFNNRASTKKTKRKKKSVKPAKRKRERKSNNAPTREATEQEPETPAMATITPEPKSNGRRTSARPRKEKSFGDDFVTEWDSEASFEGLSIELLAKAGKKDEDWEEGDDGQFFFFSPPIRSQDRGIPEEKGKEKEKEK